MSGKGYPDGMSGNELSPFVRIVSIADVFDALTTERPHQKSKSSFAALSLMNTQISDDFDRDYFRAFVSLMGKPEG
jgi:HD-GYP domain-containing protein (c-di-GMP phosphodiesterase class II)